MRKKTIFIVALAVVGVLGTVFAVLNIHAPDELSIWQKKEIEYRYEKEFDQEMGPWEDEIESPYEGFTRYYGTDNGYIILYKLENVMWGAGFGMNIGKYEFTNSGGRFFRFFAYKDGEFLQLKDAYEKGLISDSALASTWEKFFTLDRN